jgi:ribosomal protein S18 acetylase RimI-like enzyme
MKASRVWGAFFVAKCSLLFTMLITNASLLDLNALSRLEHACFGKDAWSIFDLIAVLTFADVVRLKALESGQMIGFVAGDPRPAEALSWIATIGVLPEYRRRGIGRELLRACEERLKTPRVRLSVRASNAGAIRLYDQEGYQRVEVWQGYYNDGEAAIVMEKQRGI